MESLNETRDNQFGLCNAEGVQQGDDMAAASTLK